MIKNKQFKEILKENNWGIKLNKLLLASDTNVITFCAGDVKKRVEKIYKKRQKAHDVLLEVDKELDTLLKELSGYDK